MEKEQEDTSMDYEKIKEGVRLMLEGIGEDVTRGAFGNPGQDRENVRSDLRRTV